MSQFQYAVATILPLHRVWQIFADVTKWREISQTYETVKWMGEPWQPGSTLRASVRLPSPIEFQYHIASCQPGHFVRYIAQGEVLGFAVERIVLFHSVENGTLIETRAYHVGSPVRPLMTGEVSESLKQFTIRWYDDIVRYCDLQAKTAQSPHVPGVSPQS